MCAGSAAKIGDIEVSVYMGDHGGTINVGELEYNQSGIGGVSRDELIARLNTFEKHELTVLIANLIDNSADEKLQQTIAQTKKNFDSRIDQLEAAHAQALKLAEEEKEAEKEAARKYQHELTVLIANLIDNSAE